MSVKNFTLNIAEQQTVKLGVVTRQYGTRAGRRINKIEQRRLPTIQRRTGPVDRRGQIFDRRINQMVLPEDQEKRVGPIERRRIPPQRQVTTRRNQIFERRQNKN